MIKSMTGFGSASPEAGHPHTWDIRSVNSRFLDIKWHLPTMLRAQESRWEKIVRSAAERGRLDITLSLGVSSGENDRQRRINLDAAAAGTMLDQLADLAVTRGLKFEPDLNLLLTISPLWNDSDNSAEKNFMEDLDQGLKQALDAWNHSRETEGFNLAADLHERFGRLGEWSKAIALRAPEVKEEKFQTMRSRIEGVLEKYAVEGDASRMIQELAVLSDRLDISEEMTRLASHLGQLKDLLARGGEIGKRLDFIIQECFREINTCGNKAQDSTISLLVVDAKTELEKCREQVQNIE